MSKQQPTVVPRPAADPGGPVTVRRIPDPGIPVPIVARPTLALLVAGPGLWCLSTTLYLTGTWPWWAAVAANAVGGYLSFTVAHDAGHHSASSVKWINDTMGRLATPFFALHSAFPVWRFIHGQHHRFTNHDDGSDPDHYTMGGPRWQRPLRWLTIDYYYMAFYLRRIGGRRRAERIEAIAAALLFAAVYAGLIATGHTIELLVLLFVPSRLAVLYLAWAFDYLPHHGLHHTPSQDKFRATRNRIGLEWLLTPVMLYQNYHLVHHLHPAIPFYRYLVVWGRNEASYLERNPALSTVGGRELTVEEYRQLRDLVDHH